jgi:hypothetical protein
MESWLKKGDNLLTSYLYKIIGVYPQILDSVIRDWLEPPRSLKSPQPNYPDLLNPIYLCMVEVSAKSGKDNTGTLSLVINRVRLKENLPKSKLTFKGGGGPLKAINFDSFFTFSLDFFYPRRLHCYIFTPPTYRTTMLRFCISYRISTFHTETS